MSLMKKLGKLVGETLGSTLTEKLVKGSSGKASQRISEPGFDVVGESHYQDNIDKIAGGKTEEGHELQVDAILVREPSNQYDKNAVRVDVNGMTVGYLDRASAKTYIRKYGDVTTISSAVVVGGWKRGRKDSGSYGVRLVS